MECEYCGEELSHHDSFGGLAAHQDGKKFGYGHDGSMIELREEEMEMDSFELKIGRHTYTISEKDQFMDNGSCVQLLTQSKERISWGHRPSPVLSLVAIKQIASYRRKKDLEESTEKAAVFSLCAMMKD